MQLSSVVYEHARNNRFADAIRVFFRIVSDDFAIDHHLLPTVFKSCAGLSALAVGKQVHSVSITSGHSSKCIINNSLIHMYLKCDQANEARRIFDKLPNPDIVSSAALLSEYAQKGLADDAKEVLIKINKLGLDLNTIAWNGLIAGFNRSKIHMEAIQAFKAMHSAGAGIDGVSISSVLPAIGSARMITTGLQTHSHSIKCGLEACKWVVSALIDMYGKCSRGKETRQVFDEMNFVDIASCNALLTGLSRNGLVSDALLFFKRFQTQRRDLNVVSWTSVISACSQNGKDFEAMEIFRDMLLKGEKPNEMTITSVLPSCGNMAALKQGKSIHCFSLRTGICNDTHVGSSLIDMYAKCGKLKLSHTIFKRMKRRNLVSWNALINGYAMHGEHQQALNLFTLMQEKGEKPDQITFTSLLNACSHCGLLKEGFLLFNSMWREHKVEVRMEHFACMISLLGRYGRLKEAYEMIREMPYEADGCVWGTFLNACRVHRELDLGVVAAEKLFELEPENAGNYVLLANIYCSKGMWEEANGVRDFMMRMNVRKNAGCSWIEVDNEIHMLLSGDDCHFEVARIYEMLWNLGLEMNKFGGFNELEYAREEVF